MQERTIKQNFSECGQGRRVNTHEARRIGDVGANFAVNLNELLHYDVGNFSASEGVFETIAEQNDEGQALPKLVGTSRRTGSL